jgi:hypothetical protein
MGKEGRTGLSEATPKKTLFGAGTIHKGLAYTAPTYTLTSDTAIVSGKTYYTRSGTSPNYTYTAVTTPVAGSLSSYYELSGGGWNFGTTCVGATNGGSTLTITPEFVDVPYDGNNLKVKELKKKVGETATLAVNFAELSSDLIKASTIATSQTATEDSTMDLIESKPDIDDDDFWDNIAFVGLTLEGKKIIAILDNALCTSGLPIQGQNRNSSTIAATFESHVELDDDSDMTTLPWHIYYPKTYE